MSIETVNKHMKDGSMKKAVIACEDLVSRNPEDLDAQSTLGQMYTTLGRTADAIVVFRKLLESQPHNHLFINHLAEALSREHAIGEALELYDQALALAPDFAPGLINKGHLLRGLRRYDEARKVYQELAKHYPDVAISHLYLAQTYLQLGEPEPATELFEKAVAMSESKHGMLARIAGGYHDVKDWPNAAAFLKQAIEQAPDEGDYYLDLAIIYRKQGDYENAREFAEAALQKLPPSAKAFHELGRINKNLRAFDAAEHFFEKAIALQADHAESWGNIGSIHRRKGNWSEALRCYNRALSLNPDLLFVHFARARVFKFNPGDPEFDDLVAIKQRENLSDSDSCHLAFAMGKALDDMGDYRAAFEEYRKANEFKRSEPGPKADLKKYKMQQCTQHFDKASLADDVENGLPTLVLIIGMSRSGKTLTESVLAQNSHVHDLGEDRRFPDALIKLIQEEGSRSYPWGFDEVPIDKIRELGVDHLKMLQAENPEAKVFLNTLPSMVSFIGAMFQAIPGLRVISCQRQMLDQCLESYFKNYADGNDYSYDLFSLGEYWIDYRSMANHWRNLHGDRVLKIEYETLVTDPDRTLPMVYAHCGLEYSKSEQRIELNANNVGRWRNYAPELIDVFSDLAEKE